MLEDVLYQVIIRVCPVAAFNVLLLEFSVFVCRVIVALFAKQVLVVVVIVDAREIFVVSPYGVEEVHLVGLDCSYDHLVINLDGFIHCYYQSIVRTVSRLYN